MNKEYCDLCLVFFEVLTIFFAGFLGFGQEARPEEALSFNQLAD